MEETNVIGAKLAKGQEESRSQRHDWGRMCRTSETCKDLGFHSE